jgi:hypothetical protein
MQQLAVFLIVLHTIAQADGTYIYTITIDPTRGTDNSSCYPSANEPAAVSSIPCQSLDFALLFQQRSFIKYYLTSPNEKYYLSNKHENGTRFVNERNIGFFGNDSLYPVLPTIECEPEIIGSAGLSFLNSTDIAFNGLKFLFCGTPQKSTSRDFSSPEDNQGLVSLLMIRVSLYFHECTNVNLYRVVISNSTQAIGAVMYDNDGLINITSCNFTNNVVTEDMHVSGGGGLAIEFTYCKPNNTCNDTNYAPRKNKNSIYVLSSCTFSSNHAHGQNSTEFGGKLSLASNSSHQALGRGGAISMYFKGDAANNSIRITDCRFINNTAVWGGGLIIEMDDNVTGISIYVANSEFTNNYAYHDEDFGTGGGAIFISATIHFWKDNINGMRSRIHIDSVNFTNNQAIEGGAIAFAVSPFNSYFPNDLTELLVSHCIFDSNLARLGAAVSIFNYPVANEGYLPTVILKESSFVANAIVYLDETAHPLGTGTVYANEVPLKFQGNTSFVKNSGTALSAVGDKVSFDDHSSASFISNDGLLGGGIALLGTSFLLVGEDVKMNFVSNYASQFGGAIYNEYLSREDLKSSINCFIRYKEPFTAPKDWKVQFFFANNTADKHGQSIYSTAILPCLYGDNEVKNIFCWKDDRQIKRWIYEDSNCTDQIYTQPQKFTLRNMDSISSTIEAYPGHAFRLPLDAWDDLDHNVTEDSVYYAYIADSSTADVKSGYTHVASNYISITGEPQDNLGLVMQTVGSLVNLNVTLNECPPGFDLHGDTKTLQCICSDNDYRTFLKCNAKKFKSKMNTKFWYGLVDSYSNETYLMGYIPQYFVSSAHRFNGENSFIDLPRDLSELENFLCEPLNRQGVLCGECLPDYAVAINSPEYECVLCNTTDHMKSVGLSVAYIILTYVPITILFGAVIKFNINLANSATAGFVLYAQIISSEFFDITAYQLSYLGAGESTTKFKETYLTIFGVFNLRSFSLIFPPFCIINSEWFNILFVLFLDYIIALYPIAIIIMVYVYKSLSCCQKAGQYCTKNLKRCCSRCKKCAGNTKRVSKNDSLVHSFLAFMILSYSKFGLASIKTLVYTDLFDSTGNSRVKQVQLAGTLSYFTDIKYIPYGVIAIFIVILCVALPPILLTGGIDLMNWITEKFQWLRKCWRSDIAQIYRDAFEGYKPKRHWFAGIYFWFRLIMFVVYCFTPTIFLQYFLQQVFILALLVLIAVVRPYSNEFYNYWDAALFFNLGLLNSFALYMFVNGFSLALYIIEGFLVFLPLVLYIFGYTLRRLCSKYGGKPSAKSTRVHGFIQLTRHLSLSGEDEPFIRNDDADLDKRAEEKNTYKPSEDFVLSPPPTTSYVQM